MTVLDRFVADYGVCVLAVILGTFFVAVSYYAQYHGRSGGWFLGGFLIAIGFLTSPLKWLALLGLVDYGYWGLPYMLITEHIFYKRFDAARAKYELAAPTDDDTKSVRLHIPQKNKTVEYRYETESIYDLYELSALRLVFAICFDRSGKRYLYTDRLSRGYEPKMLPFDDDTITIEGMKLFGRDMSAEITVHDKEDTGKQ